MWLESHLGSAQVSRVIYGAIIGMALVVGLQAHPPKPGLVAASLIATAFAVGLAELYSDFIATETTSRERVARAHWSHLMKDVTGVFFGIAFPAIFFVLAAFGVFEEGTAFRLAKWSGVALIFFYGYAAGRLSGRNRASALTHALLAAAIGLALIAFKAVVQH
jgi:hypothetical protein